MKRLPLILIFSIGLAGMVTLSAQDNLPSEQVQVIKNFEARLADANKLPVTPSLPPADTTTLRYNYRLQPKSLSLEYEAPTIRPLGIKTEKQDPGYDGLIQAGYGYPNAPYAYAGYRANPNKQLNLGASFRHLSMNDSKQYADRRFMDNDLHLESTYFTDSELALKGNADFSMDDVYQYGYDHAVYDTLSGLKRRFNAFDLGFQLYNGENNKGNINYFAGLDVYRFADNYANREVGVLLDLGAKKYIAKKHPIALEIKTDLSTLNDTTKQTLNNFNLLPSFTFHSNAFRIKAGGNVAVYDDQYFIFPDVSLALAISGNQIILFGGWTGDLQKNNFKSLATYNPFINRRITIRNSEYNDYFGGLKGNVSFIQYELKGGYKQTKDMALFQANNALPVSFDVLYDDVNLVYALGNIVLHPAKNIEVVLMLTKNFYDPATQAKAWYLPDFEGSARIQYTTMENRLQVALETYYMDKFPTLNAFEEEGFSNNLLDVNVQADFFITKRFGVFAHLNNLANIQHRRWLDYPGIGLNAIGGIQVRF